MLPSDREHRRRAYALRRMSLAVDRVIRRENPDQAAKWAKVWQRRSRGLGRVEPKAHAPDSGYRRVA